MSASQSEFLARSSSIVQTLRTYLVSQPGGIERLLPKERHSISVNIKKMDHNDIEEKGKSIPHTNNNEVRLQLLEIVKEERKFLSFLEDLYDILNNSKTLALFSPDARIFINKFSLDLHHLIQRQKEYFSELNDCVEKGFDRELWIKKIDKQNKNIIFRNQVINFNINLIFLEKLFYKVDKEQLKIAIDKDGLDKMAFYCAFQCDSVRNYFNAVVNIRQAEDSIKLLKSRESDLSSLEKNEEIMKEIVEKKENYKKALEKASQALEGNKEKAIKKLKKLGIHFGNDSASMERSFLAFEKKRDVSQGTHDLILRGQISQTGAQYLTRKALILANCKGLFLGESPEDKEAQVKLITILNNIQNDAGEFNRFIGKHEILEQLNPNFPEQHTDTFLSILLDESHRKKIEDHLKAKNQNPNLNKSLFNIKLLMLISRAIQEGTFSHKDESSLSRFYLCRELRELLAKARECGFEIEANRLEDCLRKENTRDMVEVILPLVREALMQLEPDMAEFFCSEEFRSCTGELKAIVEYYRKKNEEEKIIISKSRNYPVGKGPIAPARPASVFIVPIEEDKKTRRGSSEKAPFLPERSRRDSSERAPFPPVASISDKKRESYSGSPKRSSTSSSELVISSEFSSSSSSSDSEADSPTRYTSDFSDDRKSIEFEAKTPEIRISSPRLVSHCNFFQAQAEAKEKPNSIFSTNDVGKEKKALSEKLKKGATITENEICLMQVMSASGDATGLFLLAQAAYKGDGGLKKDPAAAWHLAQLAISRTQNSENQRRIISFQNKIPEKYVNTDCGSDLKMRIGNRDYNPKELQEAYLKEIKIAASQGARISMSCS